MNAKATTPTVLPIPAPTTSELTKMVRPPLIFENFVGCSCPGCTRSTITISRTGTLQELTGYEIPSQLNEMCDGCFDAGCASDSSDSDSDSDNSSDSGSGSDNSSDSDSECLNESGADQPFCTEYQPYSIQEVLNLLGSFLTKDDDLGGANASTN